jgi:hypothetical protein
LLTLFLLGTACSLAAWQFHRGVILLGLAMLLLLLAMLWESPRRTALQRGSSW